MLNKPKFLSPSINMYGNTVIDLNQDTIPFTCIVDGNEAVAKWRITISRIEDNVVVFDSGDQTLDSQFIPVNHRNQNVTFSINLKEYLKTDNFVDQYVLNTKATYDSDLTYYELLSDGRYEEWSYSSTTWSDKRSKLYVVNLANRELAYYWNITLIGSSGTHTTSASEAFYANSTPESHIYYSYVNNFDNKTELINNAPLEKRRVYFKADYSQRENIPIKRYGWRLTDTTNGTIVFDTITKNQVYGVDNDIYCECGGLVNGSNYLLELYIETQNGQFSIVKSVEFFVKYSVESIDGDLDVLVLNDSSAIMLDWGNIKSAEGTIKGGDVKFVQNLPITDYDNNGTPTGSTSVEIPLESSIVFDVTANGRGLNLEEDSYVVISTQIQKKHNLVLFEMSGEDSMLNPLSRRLEFSLNDNALKYSVKKGDIVAKKSVGVSNTHSERCWYIIKLYPLLQQDGTYYTDMEIVESTTVNPLLPKANNNSNRLYPSGNVYPYNGSWNQLREG